MYYRNWQSVAAPTVPQGDFLSNAIKLATEATGGWQKAQQDNAAGFMIQEAAKYQDPEALKQALASGAITQGIDPKLITPALMKQMDERVSTGIDQQHKAESLKSEKARLGILESDLAFRSKTYADQLAEKEIAKQDKAFSFDYADAVARGDDMGRFMLEKTNPEAFRRMGTTGVDVQNAAKIGIENKEAAEVLARVGNLGSPLEQDALLRSHLAKIEDPATKARFAKRYEEAGFALYNPDYLSGLRKYVTTPPVTAPEVGRTSEAALSAYVAANPTTATPTSATSAAPSSSFVPGKLSDMLRQAPEAAYSGKTLNPSAIRAIQNELGLDANERRIHNAILEQESGNGADRRTSVDNAAGPGQMIQSTFDAYAVGDAKDRNHPLHNLASSANYVKDLSRKFGGDPSKVAAGYFSGEGNVSRNPGQVFKQDNRDGNKTATSTYVNGILRRLPKVKDHEIAPNATSVIAGQTATNAVPKNAIDTTRAIFAIPNDGTPEALAIRERALGEIQNTDLRLKATQVNQAHVTIGNDEQKALDLINAELPKGTTQLSKKDYDKLYADYVGSRTDVSAGAFAKMVTMSMPKRGVLSGFFAGESMLSDKLTNLGDTDLKVDRPTLAGLVKDFTGIEANVKQGLKAVGAERVRNTVAFGKAIDETTTEIATIKSAMATATMTAAYDAMPKLRQQLARAEAALKDLQAKETRQAGKAVNLLSQ